MPWWGTSNTNVVDTNYIHVSSFDEASKTWYQARQSTATTNTNIYHVRESSDGSDYPTPVTNFTGVSGSSISRYYIIHDQATQTGYHMVTEGGTFNNVKVKKFDLSTDPLVDGTLYTVSTTGNTDAELPSNTMPSLYIDTSGRVCIKTQHTYTTMGKNWIRWKLLRETTAGSMTFNEYVNNSTVADHQAWVYQETANNTQYHCKSGADGDWMCSLTDQESNAVSYRIYWNNPSSLANLGDQYSTTFTLSNTGVVAPSQFISWVYHDNLLYIAQSQFACEYTNGDTPQNNLRLQFRRCESGGFTLLYTTYFYASDFGFDYLTAPVSIVQDPTDSAYHLAVVIGRTTAAGSSNFAAGVARVDASTGTYTVEQTYTNYMLASNITRSTRAFGVGAYFDSSQNLMRIHFVLGTRHAFAYYNRAAPTVDADIDITSTVSTATGILNCVGSYDIYANLSVASTPSLTSGLINTTYLNEANIALISTLSSVSAQAESVLLLRDVLSMYYLVEAQEFLASKVVFDCFINSIKTAVESLTLKLGMFTTEVYTGDSLTVYVPLQDGFTLSTSQNWINKVITMQVTEYTTYAAAGTKSIFTGIIQSVEWQYDTSNLKVYATSGVKLDYGTATHRGLKAITKSSGQIRTTLTPTAVSGDLFEIDGVEYESRGLTHYFYNLNGAYTEVFI